MNGSPRGTRASAPPRDRSIRVFLSYREDDAARAEELRHAARRFGDVELYSLPYAQAPDRDWRASFADLIASADALVCLVGPTTRQSANIAWELSEAARRTIPLVLVGPASEELAATLDADAESLGDAVPEHVLHRLLQLG